ncbi:uncharacterized protein BDZ99DRAFT_554506 [Mytilinidion resinicola]|uniref:Uncharacterized protein n=1 Tax=Mytilinidion resinicola TaxID=574789 RepID=A0A6A6Z1V2_9PEZI|nr:uncharacterized protein BDZ99DRAFT_554506 [Mytilinidion resinicola]KAF2814165.1 hypothetical protein BDZ99DRAFT_554506 [Mytilinidion resinicola]
MLPLRGLAKWAPFKIDALGLVTLLGVREVDQAIGKLTYHRYLEFLPLLGAHVVAGNAYLKPIRGFELYNLTDEIKATDASGWFARWILGHSRREVQKARTVIRITDEESKKEKPGWVNRSSVMGAFVLCVLVVLPALIGDWWGLSNGIFIATSIVVRWFLLQQVRSVLDQIIDDMKERNGQKVKVLMVLPTGSAVTICATRGIILALLTSPSQLAVRCIGWAAFVGNALTLGSPSLFYQMICIVIQAVATMLYTWGHCEERFEIGSRLKLEIDKEPPSIIEDNRHTAYARLNLSETEENCMVTWALASQRGNGGWWLKYFKRKHFLFPDAQDDGSKSAEGGAGIGPHGS